MSLLGMGNVQAFCHLTEGWGAVQAYCPSWGWVMFRFFATVTGGWVNVQTPLIAPLGDG